MTRKRQPSYAPVMGIGEHPAPNAGGGAAFEAAVDAYGDAWDAFMRSTRAVRNAGGVHNMAAEFARWDKAHKARARVLAAHAAAVQRADAAGYARGLGAVDAACAAICTASEPDLDDVFAPFAKIVHWTDGWQTFPGDKLRGGPAHATPTAAILAAAAALAPAREADDE